jgi:hypothetical protein
LSIECSDGENVLVVLGVGKRTKKVNMDVVKIVRIDDDWLKRRGDVFVNVGFWQATHALAYRLTSIAMWDHIKIGRCLAQILGWPREWM